MQIKEALLGGVLVYSGHHATWQVSYRLAIRLSLYLQNGHSRPDTGKGRKHKTDINCYFSLEIRPHLHAENAIRKHSINTYRRRNSRLSVSIPNSWAMNLPIPSIISASDIPGIGATLSSSSKIAGGQSSITTPFASAHFCT